MGHWLEREIICDGDVLWRTVLFPDESRFKLFIADVRSRIYRRHNERYACANCDLEYDRFGGGGAMVWVGIHRDGRTALVRVNGALNAQI